MSQTFPRLFQPQIFGKLLLVVLAYFASGRLGLAIPYVGSHITLFWLPTGIAVAVLFRFGVSFWPGIYLGALLVNLSIGSSWVLAAGIAVGNTLSPALTAWLLHRHKFHPAFDRREDIVLLCVAAALGMLISASGGSAMLWLAGLVNTENFFSAAFSWWSGDFVGVLLGGALLLSMTRDSLKLIQRNYIEFLVWAALTCFIGWAVFFDNAGNEVKPLAFFTFPVVVWASLRFGVTGASISVVLLSLIAAWSTSMGRGQYYPHGLFLLWAYMSILVVSVLMITALLAERKHAEVRLRESMEKLQGMYELSPLGIAMTDMQGYYVEFNEAFRHICGYSAEELKKLDYWALTPQEYAEQEAHQLECLEHLGRYGPYEKEYIRKDGSRVPLQLNGMLVTDRDGQRYIWSIVEDISERKHTEQRMQENQDRLTSLIESAMDAIVSTDENQNITLFNHAAELVFGHRAADIIGRPIEVIIPSRYHSTHRQHVEEYGRTGFTARTLAMPGIASGLRANGEEFPLEASISQVEVAGRKIYTAILRDISARLQAKAALKQNEERLRQAVNIAGIGLFDHNLITDDLYWSPQMRAILGFESDQPVTMHDLIECLYPADREWVVTAIRRAHETAEEEYIALTYRIVRRDGAVRWLDVQFRTSFAGEGEMHHPVRIVGAVRDITQRKQNEEALQLAASVYQASNEGILVTDENNLIVGVNPAFTHLTGYALDEVFGKNPSMFRSGKYDQQFYQQMWQSIQSDGHWQGEIWDRRKDGELHAKWLNISVIRHPDGSIYRHVGQFSDITEKKRVDELIWTQANFDPLTSLPNRRLLADRIHQSMSSGMRSGRHGALVLLDLDQFKRLNDTFGHGMGDKLLIEVAHRLRTCVREEDTVARMGGDEFLVVLSELSSNPEEAAIHAEQVAEKIRSELCLPYRFGETEYHTTTSAGIVIFHGHLNSAEELFSHVDTAMYQAKSKGRNTICFFDTSMQAALEQRNVLESSLRVALAHRELMLYYQLQVDNAGRPIGAEALLRWGHPSLGMVSPAQFIPVAEETGLILPIGLWVLETACVQLACWQTDPRLSHLSIAVNVSARQFRESIFVPQVRDALKKSGIKPEVLKLELTESMVLDNVEDSIRKMEELKKLGVKFSMDDFGTGYSSLSYLSRLPIDQLKIDQSFVRNIATDQSDAAIVQTIIAMALSLGLEVIAEGVETEAQREFLELRGCQAYQGYFYAKPLPIEELERKLFG